MRKLNAIFILIVFTLCACGQVRADVPDNPEAKATQNIVEEYIIANEDYDADLLVGLYSDKLVYFDYGMSIGPINKGNLDYFIHETMAARDFKLHVKSYNVTPDGRFAAMVAEYSEKSGGKKL